MINTIQPLQIIQVYQAIQQVVGVIKKTYPESWFVETDLSLEKDIYYYYCKVEVNQDEDMAN